MSFLRNSLERVHPDVFDPLDVSDRPRRRGAGFIDDDLRSLLTPPIWNFPASFNLRPRPQAFSPFAVEHDKDKFEVILNITQFTPDQVRVTVVGNSVVIRGKHEEKSDEHGFIQREFTRRYVLPEGTEADAIKSSWSPNGLLTIEAPRKAAGATLGNEREIPIVLAQEEKK